MRIPPTTFPFRFNQYLFVLALAVIRLLATERCVADDTLVVEPGLAYQAERSSPVVYDIELKVVVTAPYKSKQLRVWVPLPTTDVGQEVLDSQLTTFPEDLTPQIESEPVFGNRFAYWEFNNPQGAIIVAHRLKIRVWELHWSLKPDLIRRLEKWPDVFEPYLNNERQAVQFDDRFRKLLGELVPKPTNPLDDLQVVIGYAFANFRYDHVNASLQASSLHAMEQNCGHCSDYHGFCAAMGRLMQVPTRITYGINTFAKASPSHCKLEAFLAPVGWISFDVSETQKLVSLIRQSPHLNDTMKAKLVASATKRLASGFRDNTWFLQTRGTDYELSPPASRRVAVVRTIYAEADGVALKEPDPSNKEQSEFAWMTAIRFSADRSVAYPFTDFSSLQRN